MIKERVPISGDLKSKVKQLMEYAGWQEGRKVDISIAEKYYADHGVPMMKTTQRFYRKYFGLCCEWYLEQKKLNWAADFQFALFPFLVNGIKSHLEDAYFRDMSGCELAEIEQAAGEKCQPTLESFSDKYPHQVAAVKAEVAYFNLDYEKALALDLTILPWLEEWYYSNVSDEHMIAMTVAAIQLHREQELIEALMKEQARIRAENGLPQRDRFCGIMIDCLTRGVMPFAEGNKNAPYCEPEEPQTREQLWEQIKSKNKKLTPDDPKGKAKLFYLCCLYGSAKDVVALFEELRGTPLGQAAYEDVIARCLYLGDREKALEITEELATSRLWSAAAPTQVRPMNFFENPNLREFLLEPESLRRIREAAFIDNGTLTRK